MALTNTTERYGRVAQTFHWLTAAMILILLPLGVIMHELPLGTADEVALKVWMYSLHKTLGVAVLAVAVLRIIWALANPHPKPLHPERALETFAATMVHWMLYAGIILAPLTGLAHHFASEGFAPIWWPFAQTVPFIPQTEFVATLSGTLHYVAAVMIGVSVLAHVAGALKHVFIDRDKTVTRMVCGDDEVITLPLTQGTRTVSGLAGAAAFVVIGLAALGGTAWGLQAATPTSLALDLSASEAETARSDAPRWQVFADESTLAISVNQLGSPVSGAFSNWTADIAFDPDALETASVDVRIDIGSLTLGTVSQQATGPEFLQASAFPQARFTSNDFVQLDDGSYEARGTLTIRDVEQPFVLPFTLAIADGRATMEATATIDRLAFGVGSEGYPNEDSVGFAVTVIVNLVADRQDEDTPAG